MSNVNRPQDPNIMIVLDYLNKNARTLPALTRPDLVKFERDAWNREVEERKAAKKRKAGQMPKESK